MVSGSNPRSVSSFGDVMVSIYSVAVSMTKRYRTSLANTRS
jgi:hypothetical protein